MVGRTLGHYEIIEPLGAGGMGEVYLAEDTTLDRQVALKVLPSDLASDPERRQRFEREAKAIAALDHPNIVVVHSVEEAEGIHFITMQLVDGKTLSELIPRNGFLLEKFFDLAIPLADAVSAAHEQGIVHRDLKPANIMVSDDGRVRVLDFGLAKLGDETAGARGQSELATVQATSGGSAEPLTEEGRILGTVAYMSPEQAEGKLVDPRSDVFSLGILIYEMVTGKRPFKGDTTVSIMSSIVKEKPTSITELNRNLPRHLGRIVNKCLDKDPKRRYQSALGLRNDLEELRREVESGEVSAVADVVQTSVRSGSARAVRLSVGVVALVILAWVMWMFLPSSSDRNVVETGGTIHLTRDAGLEIHPSISPDGRTVAYAAGPSLGDKKIYLRQIASDRPVPLTGGFSGDHDWPRWSPDGEEIAFTTDGRIWVVPYLGGNPRPLVTAPEGSSLGLDLAWSPNGDEIAYTVNSNTMAGAGLEVNLEIHRRKVGATDSEVVTTVFDPYGLTWSPDGTMIAFASGNSSFLTRLNLAPSSLWVVSAGGGDPVRLTEDAFLDVSPVWTPDSRSIFFVSNRDGSRDVYNLSIGPTGQPLGHARRLTSGLNVHTISMSEDGRTLAFSTFTTRQNIWTLPIPNGEPVSVAKARQLTQGNQTIEGIDVSSDGQWLAYDSNQAGSQDIYKMRIDGEDPPIQLTFDPQDDFMPAWSPDGTLLAFHSFRTGNRDLYVMPADGGSPRQLTDHPGHDRYPDWAADGESLVFYSDRSGRQEVYSLLLAGELEGAMAQQLTSNGGTIPEFSPDGTKIAFVDNDFRLLTMAPSGGQERIVFADRIAFDPRWSPDNNTIYFRTSFLEGGTGGDIWSTMIGGASRLLVRFDDPIRFVERPEFATDGERFFFTLTAYEADVWVLELSEESSRHP
jgi:serine/threonine protein kinase/Tol biopolymer transport system component